MYINERMLITAAAVVLAGALAYYNAKTSKPRRLLLSITTPLFTLVLLAYYHYFIREAAHGMVILILPVATGWLHWRRLRIGKPELSARTWVLMQILFCLLFGLLIRLQEG